MPDPMPSVVSASPQSSALISSPNLLCGGTQEYTFCGSTAQGGDFYLAVPSDPKFPQSSDIRRIQGWFGTADKKPDIVEKPPAGIDVKLGARLYRITPLLPRIVAEKNGSSEHIVGPNCYGTALSSAGYERLLGRHVDSEEFRYYLTRDYDPVFCGSANIFGAILVYGNNQYEYDAGAHAAFLLPGGLVFHKGGWAMNYPYEVVPLNGAIEAMDSYCIPTREERMGGKVKCDPTETKTIMCYRKWAEPPARKPSSTPRDRAWFMPLFAYYSRRMREAAKLQWGEFADKRANLMTVENMWRVLKGFSDRVGNINRATELLKIDDGAAEAYLELQSFDWQCQAMIETYALIREGRAQEMLEELYRKHYVNIDSAFDEELTLYLDLLKVPAASREAVRKGFIERIKKYDPVKFAQYNGGKGLPYLDELVESIRSADGSWRPPEESGIKLPIGMLPIKKDGSTGNADRKEKDFKARRHKKP